MESFIERRRRITQQAEQQLEWMRENIRAAIEAVEELDVETLHALTGVSSSTIRAFLAGTSNTGTRETLLIRIAFTVEFGIPVDAFLHKPDDFAHWIRKIRGGK